MKSDQEKKLEEKLSGSGVQKSAEKDPAEKPKEDLKEGAQHEMVKPTFCETKGLR